MNKIVTIILKATMVLVLGSMISCGDDKPPASQKQVVSQKINTKKAKPNNQKDSAKAGSVSKSDELKPTTGALNKEGEATQLAGQSEKAASDLIKESLAMTSTYDAKGRFDPFAPLFSEEPETQVVQPKGRKKKRTPQTPLEKVALSQLKLTAVMRTPNGNRALVEDATGKGFVVKRGTYMGLNAGQVIRIERNRILIEEEIQNMVGDYIINNAELKLQKTAGDQ